MTHEARGKRGNPINQKRQVMQDRRTKRLRARSERERAARTEQKDEER